MNTEKIDLIKVIEETEKRKKKKAPESGMVYAVYQDRVEYKAYRSLTEVLARENLAEGLLELHLFDEHKEYRFIKKRKGFISEFICDDDPEKEKNIYEEKIYTEDSEGKEGRVCVVNYMTFDEDDDLLQIEKYRLKGVK